MHKTLREKEVCETCKKVIFNEESIIICDICEKEIIEGSDGWKYTLRMIKMEQSENMSMGSDAWTFDLCSLKCFFICLETYHHLDYDNIWGFHLDKKDVGRILEMIKVKPSNIIETQKVENALNKCFKHDMVYKGIIQVFPNAIYQVNGKDILKLYEELELKNKAKE